MAAPMLVTVNGTGVPDPFGPGFSGDMGRAISNPWNAIAAQFWGANTPRFYNGNIFWQPIGYPAGVFPMMPSVNKGVAEVSRQVMLHEQDGSCPPGFPLFLSGYSQGALVTDIFWRDFVLSPAGIHHNRLNDILAFGGIINFGDPMRCPGIARGNDAAGLPEPNPRNGVLTGGIAGPGCLTPEQTPDVLLSCALDGDLYGAAPVGPAFSPAVATGAPWVNEPLVGQIQTRIYSFIESGSILTGLLAVAKGVSQEFQQPLTNTIALVEAIFDGLTFAAAGTNAPHWRYGPFVPGVVQWMVSRANAFYQQQAA